MVSPLYQEYLSMIRCACSFKAICNLSSVFSVQKSKQPSTILTGLSAAKSEYRKEVKAMKQNISLAFDRYSFSLGNSKWKKCINSLYFRKVTVRGITFSLSLNSNTPEFIVYPCLETHRRNDFNILICFCMVRLQ